MGWGAFRSLVLARSRFPVLFWVVFRGSDALGMINERMICRLGDTHPIQEHAATLEKLPPLRGEGEIVSGKKSCATMCRSCAQLDHRRGWNPDV